MILLRGVGLFFLVGLIGMTNGCKSARDPKGAPIATASVPPSPSPPSPSASSSSSTTTVVDGELKTTNAVAFEVRPLGGPGTMGPTVLAASSDRALEEVRAYLMAHADASPLRIECGANPRMMSSDPNTRWPAGLAQRVARWLVEHGIDCKRLEVVGWLDRADNAPAERVRFFIGKKSTRPPDQETRLDACAK